MRLRDEKDPERLRQAALLLEQENARLVQKNLELQKANLALLGRSPEELQLRMAQLEQQLAAAQAAMFGASSEQRPKEKAPRERAEQTGHGPREQQQLEVVPRTHELDEADKTCPSCGGALAEWAGQFEESEEIDVVERKFVIVKHQRKKYRCACNACVETAPGPVKLIPGGRYSVDFAIDVAISKYLDHLPLERQVRVMAREGLVVDSQTLWDQIEALARRVAGAYRALHASQLLQPVLGVDETHWLLMGKKQNGGVDKRHQLWAVASPNAVYYKVQDNRSSVGAGEMLPGYRGVVMADGYGAYVKLQREKPTFALVHCWDHVRRKFVAAEKFFPKDGGDAVELIGRLYEIERQAPQGPPGDELRARLRAEHSKPAIAAIQAWALEARTRVLPSSAVGEAIDYMLGLWPGLTAFLWDARVPLSNAFTERAMRGPVVGRKNHYGSRSKRGTEVAAIFYSLLESAKLCGLDPKAYLRTAALAAIAGQPVPLPHQLATPAPA